jgi:hypothetical protein
MFSKAGRVTTEKYIIFHRKDEILYDKKRENRPFRYPNGKYPELQVNLNKIYCLNISKINRKKRMIT